MREDIRQKIWILAFFVIICGAHLVWFVMGKRLDEENYENRTAVERPAFSFAAAEEFPAAYEAYYNDHLPFRNQLIRLGSKIEYYVFKGSSNQNVIRGRDEWLFYNSSLDDNPIEAYKGMDLFTEEELARIADNLTHTQAVLAAQGTEFVLFIAPNKERVYAENMPDYYGAPAENYKVKQLVDYLREKTDIRVVYPYEELMEAKEQNARQLYYRLDTHWNYIGAYVGCAALAKELGVQMPELSELTVTETEPTICDLADMINLRTSLNTDPDYALLGYDQHGLITDRHELTGSYVYHCTGADPRKLFMVRDSFADAMDDFLASQFDQSVMVHYSSYSHERAFAEDPDIYVYETVERRVGELLNFRMK
ncbi:MAG: hypothetical protein J6C33_00685 [Lachnospiraceae bacterium]|nr:hypothetical protein [Lachnospiraceae bacterium]